MASPSSPTIYSSDTPLPPLQPQSVFEYLLGNVSFDDPTRAFVESAGGKSITLGALKLQAQQLGTGLTHFSKLQHGDVVLLCAPNSLSWIVALLATQFAGLRTALANPAYTPGELAHAVRLTQPSLCIATIDSLRGLVAAGVEMERIVLLDAERLQGDLWGVGDHRLLMVDEKVAREAKSAALESFEETAYLTFSSGTTGLPKACSITHRNVLAMLTSINLVEDGLYKRSLRTLGVLPFYHAFALLMNVHTTITSRGTLHILGAFDPAHFLRTVSAERIQFVCVVPPIFVFLAKHPAATPEALKSLEVVGCGAAPLDADIQIAFEKKFSAINVIVGYGMSEATIGAVGFRKNQTPGTVGTLLPGTEARLVDPETGQDVPTGESGEVWVRSQNVFKGYYRNQQATDETMTSDGWLKTGDVATINNKMEFRIVDRFKEILKYKGYQVAPAELEGILLAHPKVAAAAVIGVYDKEQATELPRAYVQLAPDLSDSEDSIASELKDFVASRVSSAKYLRGGVRVIKVVPVSPSGKILRKELRALVQKELEQDANPKL